MKRILYFCFLVILPLVSCKQKEDIQLAENLQQQDNSKKELEKKLIDANNRLMQVQDVQIDGYVARRNWTMQKFENGLRIWEYKKGNGKRYVSLDKVSLKYRLELINGTEIANSEKDGLLSFEIGKGQAAEGLEIAVQILSQGSKAKVIVPSYLGYGFAGDGENIPKQAILIYDIEVL